MCGKRQKEQIFFVKKSPWRRRSTKKPPDCSCPSKKIGISFSFYFYPSLLLSFLYVFSLFFTLFPSFLTPPYHTKLPHDSSSFSLNITVSSLPSFFIIPFSFHIFKSRKGFNVYCSKRIVLVPSMEESTEFEVPLSDLLDTSQSSQDIEFVDIKQTSCCVRNYDLHCYPQIPDYLQHNPFIEAGYRVNLSFWQTTYSFFHWHNESLNVWTHFVGFLFFAVLAIISYTTWLNQVSIGELFSSTAFFMSVVTMMLFSSIFHLYSCCSSDAYDFTAKLDYSGITILIVGSYYPLLYYMYYCPEQWIWRYGYGSIITFLGIIALVAVWKGVMHTPGTEVIRLSIFMGMGFFGVIPLPQSMVRRVDFET